jgi:hypothetical protein
VLHRADETATDTDDDHTGDRGQRGVEQRAGHRGGDADLVQRGLDEAEQDQTAAALARIEP